HAASFAANPATSASMMASWFAASSLVSELIFPLLEATLSPLAVFLSVSQWRSVSEPLAPRPRSPRQPLQRELHAESHQRSVPARLQVELERPVRQHLEAEHGHG